MKSKTIVSELVSEDSQNQFRNLIADYVCKNMSAGYKSSTTSNHRVDPQTKRLLSYLFTSTRGEPNRLRIMLLLGFRPVKSYRT